MHNKALILSTLEDIQYSLKLIQNRVKDINSSDDFLTNESGLEKLDSISIYQSTFINTPIKSKSSKVLNK